MKGTEPWAKPMFWMCLLEERCEPEQIPRGARRERCCDCNRIVVVTYHGTATALIKPLLWICVECVKLREIDDGPTWKLHVHPRYRHS